MSRLSRSARLLQNAEAALLSSIEIYNKPAFAYREETFAILALNAWELLLKAKLLEINNNSDRSLFVYSPKQLASGKQSKKLYIKHNRTGNKMTVGIDECIVRLEKKGVAVPDPVKKNLAALAEVRDNAVHFINASPQLSKQVLEIGTACLRNFIELGKQWLGLDLSRYSLYLMPIGFLPTAESATVIAVSPNEQKIVNYLAMLMRNGHDKEVQDYHVSLDLNISFKRTPASAATAVIVASDPNDPNAVRVNLSEEDIRKQYPWDYTILTEKLQNRYIDFKRNGKYHDLRKKLAVNPQYKKTRYLDPANPSGQRKDFYNPNIVAEFDKSYTRKK
jgi:Protein of unknown function (DUF3644)